MSRPILALFASAFLAACSSSSTDATTPAGDCPAVASTECDGIDVKTCELQGGALRWSAASACADGQACRSGACSPITDEESGRLAALTALLHESRDNGATASPVDYDAVEASLRRELLLGDGSPKEFTRTMWHAMLALPQGHQRIGPKGEPASEAPYVNAGFSLGSFTRYGACLRPYQDHAVVTLAEATSVLKRGDEIVAIDGKRGTDFKGYLLDQPMGMDYLPPTDTGRVAFELRAFLGTDRTGTTLTVRRGTAETDVVLPAPLPNSKSYGCDDPFGRDYTRPAIGTVLPDGTGVLYISGFQQPSVAAFEQEVGPEFDKVKAAPRLVIDIRGNGGGYLKSALDFVSQIPGARQTNYCEFFDRDSGSSPATYTSRAVRTIGTDAVAQPPRFTYSGKVALLIDATTHSAAEHFALATKLATDAIIIGTKTAGAYGNVSRDSVLAVAGVPALEVSINRSQVRAMDGKPLDGNSVVPAIEVEYEPAAIAKGQDPMLLRAIAELSK